MPPAPQAGDTVSVNATVSVGTGVTGGTGQVDAYLYGIDVFEQPVNTCGETEIDVLGITSGTLDALTCPSTAGQLMRVGFVMPIPDEGAGLGQLNITLQGRDTAQNTAFCLNMTVYL
jgi:hypothetical protein